MTSDPDVTPPLDEFLRGYTQDDNIWWAMPCGHHQNLFEAAVERMERAEALLSAIRIADDPGDALVPEENHDAAEVRHLRAGSDQDPRYLQ